MKVTRTGSAMTTLTSGALLKTISTDVPDIAAAYLNLKENVLKDIGDVASGAWPKFLTIEPSDLRRQRRWIDASKKFETDGQYYSAMFCLHKAIETNDGYASDNFRKLSFLYHRVGRVERAKRYTAYANYRLVKENLSFAKRYLNERGIRKDIKEFSAEVGAMIYDDHETFNKNLEEYARLEAAKGGPAARLAFRK